MSALPPRADHFGSLPLGPVLTRSGHFQRRMSTQLRAFLKLPYQLVYGGPLHGKGEAVMRNRIAPLLLVFVIMGLLVGHKAAAAVYDDTSITIRPSPDSYGSSDEFVRDSIIYLYPRACVYYTTSDTIRSGENQKPGKFHLNSIIENAEKDGWYVSSVEPVLSGYGALSFYFNKDTGKFSCTGKGVNFENSRWLDLENLSSSPK